MSSTIQFEDSKLYTCFNLQLKAFLQQSNELYKLHQKYPILENKNISLLTKGLLQIRIERLNINRQDGSERRIIDEYEVLILGVLDSNGKISLLSRLEDFTLLMSRAIKVITNIN